jgi:hypothetical protein
MCLFRLDNLEKNSIGLYRLSNAVLQNLQSVFLLSLTAEQATSGLAQWRAWLVRSFVYICKFSSHPSGGGNPPLLPSRWDVVHQRGIRHHTTSTIFLSKSNFILSNSNKKSIPINPSAKYDTCVGKLKTFISKLVTFFPNKLNRGSLIIFELIFPPAVVNLSPLSNFFESKQVK